MSAPLSPMTTAQLEDTPRVVIQGGEVRAIIRTETVARCESRTGGGRYACQREAGHEGRHEHSHPFVSWLDDAAIPDPYDPANRARIRPADGAETLITGITVDPDGNACRVRLHSPEEPLP